MDNKEVVALRPHIVRFAKSLCWDWVEAEDIAHEAIMRALLKFPGGNLKAWLCTVVVNEHRNRRRRAIRHAELDSIPELGTSSQHEEHVALCEVRLAVGKLIPEQRSALMLIAERGMSYEEAGIVMGVPEGTIKSRVSRARAALMQELECSVE